ncbi:hypothetical protein ACFQZR_22350 [Paenibacillus sp. GCM10027629]|uniref:hypothetical protein n=1 Tax=Paenibacillus sp. GCM10027629 TaxID=3273414 RepID=UPI00362893C8
MNTKNMGFADKTLFILGLTLCGVIAFVLVVGVIVALIKLYMDDKMHSVRIESAPILDDEPEAELITAPFEQRLAETIQLHEEAVAGNADALWEAKSCDRMIASGLSGPSDSGRVSWKRIGAAGRNVERPNETAKVDEART